MLLNSWNYMIYQSCEVILLKSYVCFAFKARKYFLSGWIKKKAFRNLHSLTNFKHSLLSLNRNLCLWNMLLMLLCFGSKYKSKFQPYFYALLAFYKKMMSSFKEQKILIFFRRVFFRETASKIYQILDGIFTAISQKNTLSI